jgi:hypothetical protein
LTPGVRLESVEDLGRPPPQAGCERGLPIEPLELCRQSRPRIGAVALKRGLDLLERQAEVEQSRDMMQTAQVSLAVVNGRSQPNPAERWTSRA